MIDCPICKNERFILKINDAGEAERTICDCQIQEYERQKLSAMIKASRIPEEYAQYTFDSYPISNLQPYNKSGIANYSRDEKIQLISKNKPYFDTIKGYIDNPSSFMSEPFKVLWIWGEDPNTGHSVMAANIGCALIKKGYKVRYYEMHNLTKLIMEFKDADVVAEMNRAIDYFDVFIVNDAFDRQRSTVSSANEYLRANIFNFFQQTLSKNKKIICTSDVDIIGIGEQYNSIISMVIRSYSEMHICGTLNSLFRK